MTSVTTRPATRYGAPGEAPQGEATPLSGVSAASRSIRSALLPLPGLKGNAKPVQPEPATPVALEVTMLARSSVAPATPTPAPPAAYPFARSNVWAMRGAGLAAPVNRPRLRR